MLLPKGQASPEFSVVVGFVALVFLIMMIIIFQKQSESFEFQVYLDAKKVASTIADNVNMISQNGHGYYRYFSVPSTLHGNTDYDVSFDRNFLWINYTDVTYSVRLVTNDVEVDNLTKGDNETNCVTNVEGRITIGTPCYLG